MKSQILKWRLISPCHNKKLCNLTVVSFFRQRSILKSKRWWNHKWLFLVASTSYLKYFLYRKFSNAWKIWQLVQGLANMVDHRVLSNFNSYNLRSIFMQRLATHCLAIQKYRFVSLDQSRLFNCKSTLHSKLSICIYIRCDWLLNFVKL